MEYYWWFNSVNCNPTATLFSWNPMSISRTLLILMLSDCFFDLWRVPGPFSDLWARKYLRIIKIWTRDKISIIILALMFWKQVHRSESEYFLSEHLDRNLSTVFRRIRPFSSVLTSKIGRMLSSIWKIHGLRDYNHLVIDWNEFCQFWKSRRLKMDQSAWKRSTTFCPNVLTVKILRFWSMHLASRTSGQEW